MQRRRITIPVHNFEFMKSIPWLNQFKVRGTYGATGKVNYPPYAAFLKITVWDKNEERANGTAKEIADFLERQAKNTDAEVFGPFVGIIGKVRDLYRVNVLVKSTQINIFKTALWQSPYRDMKNVYFDVDPFNVL